MAHPLLRSAVILFVLASGMASAQSVGDQVSGTVHRISPEEAEAVQDAAAKRNINAPSLGEQRVTDGRIHGEIGFGIGTGGYNTVFGTAIVPLGDSGIAAFSFERTDFGRRRYRY